MIAEGGGRGRPPFHRRDGMRRPVSSERDALSSQSETHLRVQKGDRHMKKNTSKKRAAAPGKQEAKESFAFYIGIDLGDKHCDVCVFDGRGEVHEQFRLGMKGADLQGYFVSIGRSRVAVEAGGQSRWVAELIQRCGHEVYVSNTRKVAYIHQSDDKDDPGDAYK